MYSKAKQVTSDRCSWETEEGDRPYTTATSRFLLPILMKPHSDDQYPRPLCCSVSVPRLLVHPSWHGDQTPCFLISDWMNISRNLSCVEVPES